MSPNAAIAKSLNKVFVSFNYRLNAFGFMALDVLSWSNTKGSSGNYGLMDQMAALQWVQRNIQQFGGNPNKVSQSGWMVFVYGMIFHTPLYIILTLWWSECPNQPESLSCPEYLNMPEYTGTFKLPTAKQCHQIMAIYFGSSRVII